MLLLLFHIDDDAYGIDLSQIVEVVPLVTLTKLPYSPDCVAGIFNFRGCIAPVIDLTELLAGRQSKELLSTRIIIVNFKDHKSQLRQLGLLAEQATETMACNPADIQTSGVGSAEARYLRDILLTSGGMIHIINIENVLSKKIQELLFVADDVEIDT